MILFSKESDREIQRLTIDVRKHALSGNKEALRTLAKAIVKVKHNKSRLYSAIANLDTIDNCVKSQLSKSADLREYRKINLFVFSKC